MFSTSAIAALPDGWMAGLPGELVFAAHAELVRDDASSAGPGDCASLFAGNDLVGSEVGDGAAAVLTDFRIHADGFGRFLVLDRSLTRRQAGRGGGERGLGAGAGGRTPTRAHRSEMHASSAARDSGGASSAMELARSGVSCAS